MKLQLNQFAVFFVGFGILATPALPAWGAVLGETDTRIEKYQLPPEWADAGNSTVLLSPSASIARLPREWFSFSGGLNLATHPDFNPSVDRSHRFSAQPVLGYCSGVLIQPTIVITAAHCVDPALDPTRYQYISITAGLGYPSESVQKNNPLRIPLERSQTSSLSKILYRGEPSVVGRQSPTDFAILELDEPIFLTSYPTLKTGYEADAQAPLAILGHPYGLPLKADLQGKLASPTRIQDPLIYGFFDSGNGNSGGPIYDSASRTLIGLLVAGSTDWVGCEPDSLQQSTSLCETRRPETIEQLKNSPGITKRALRRFKERYPDGIITAWASRVVRIDHIAKKLDEMGIRHLKIDTSLATHSR